KDSCSPRPVAIQKYAACFDDHRCRDPHLPMRENSLSDRELAGESDIGANAPGSKNRGHHRKRGHDRGSPSSQMPILAFSALYLWARPQLDADTHRLSSLTAIAVSCEFTFFIRKDSKSSMKKLKTAIIGTGFMGKVHAENVRRVPNVEIAAVAGRSD